MFLFVGTVEMVDKMSCDCPPGSCSYTEFLKPLKMFFVQEVTINKKRRFFLEHCLKNKHFFEPLKEVL